MIQYKLLKSFTTSEVCSVTIVGQNISIPLDPDNTDYQAFLRWCEEGNEPLPADEGEQ
jgi:hypothetical protein